MRTAARSRVTPGRVFEVRVRLVPPIAGALPVTVDGRLLPAEPQDAGRVPRPPASWRWLLPALAPDGTEEGALAPRLVLVPPGFSELIIRTSGPGLADVEVAPLAVNWRRDGRRLVDALAGSGLGEARRAWAALSGRSRLSPRTRLGLARIAASPALDAWRLNRRLQMPAAWRRALTLERGLPERVAIAGDALWRYRLERWFDVTLIDGRSPHHRGRLAAADVLVIAATASGPVCPSFLRLAAEARACATPVLWLVSGVARASTVEGPKAGDRVLVAADDRDTYGASVLPALP